MQPGEPGIRASDLLIVGRPTLPSELQLPFYLFDLLQNKNTLYSLFLFTFCFFPTYFRIFSSRDLGTFHLMPPSGQHV